MTMWILGRLHFELDSWIFVGYSSIPKLDYFSVFVFPGHISFLRLPTWLYIMWDWWGWWERWSWVIMRVRRNHSRGWRRRCDDKKDDKCQYLILLRFSENIWSGGGGHCPDKDRLHHDLHKINHVTHHILWKGIPPPLPCLQSLLRNVQNLLLLGWKWCFRLRVKSPE